MSTIPLFNKKKSDNDIFGGELTIHLPPKPLNLSPHSIFSPLVGKEKGQKKEGEEKKETNNKSGK